MESIAITVVLGVWYTALLFSITNAALLILIRIADEERVLTTHLREEK